MTDATALTLDSVASRVTSVTPQTFYRYAALCDDAAAQIGELTDQFEVLLRALDEAWQPARTGPPSVVGTAPTRIIEMLRLLSAGQDGTSLRQAGDSLTAAQSRVRDLQLRRDQEAALAGTGQTHYDQQARLTLHSVSTVFVDVGVELPALPALTVQGDPVPITAPPPPALTTPTFELYAESTGEFDLDFDPPGSDPSSPSAPAGGAPMMPLMPMGGAGMGMAGMAQIRTQRTGSAPTSDQVVWGDARDGWDTLGRRTGRSSQQTGDQPDQTRRGGRHV